MTTKEFCSLYTNRVQEQLGRLGEGSGKEFSDEAISAVQVVPAEIAGRYKIQIMNAPAAEAQRLTETLVASGLMQSPQVMVSGLYV